MTNAYRYAVSLRIEHPSIDPAEITSALKLEPFRCWRAGEPRTTPIGKPLSGNWRESYWTSRDIANGEWPGVSLPTALGQVLDRLFAHRGFFHRIRAEGGRTEFFIGWYLEGNTGDVFGCDLLARMADLKIDFSPDIYPLDQPQRGL